MAAAASSSRSHPGPATAPSPSDLSSGGQIPLGSAALDVPPTPTNVKNLTPNTCLAIVEFKDLLRQHRQVDDTITTRLNRHLARSRDQGYLSSPSLLSSSSPLSASNAADLGQSTYSTVPEQACAQFWKELLDVWKGREDVVRYCIGVADQARGPRPSGTESKLDADYTPTPTQARWGRGEDQSEFLTRQMRNELAVESIIRKRSLEAFKSRCRFFQPSPPPGPEGDRERAMWLGRDTPAAVASAAGVSRP
ncbi:uncharacterized protein PSFLO_00862 [Pseudozyma flocculosa]|nr:uncharacterized protein PSFLO_00862 [Pseudozyma flocculosa]